MRYVLALLFFICPLFLFSQKNSGYALIYGGLSPKQGDNKGVIGFSGGPKLNKNTGIGLGIGFINFDSPYIPITLDFCFFGEKKKTTPAILVKAGHGLYDQRVGGQGVKGAFTGSANFGVSLPTGKIKPMFMIGYAYYGFSVASQNNGGKGKNERFQLLFALKL